jgi:hypothetical protein
LNVAELIVLPSCACRIVPQHGRVPRGQTLTAKPDGNVVPVVVRNPNLLVEGLCWLTFGAFWVLVDVVSSLWLGALGVALAVVSLGLAGYWLASWWRAALRVHRDGITITGLGNKRRIAWADVRHFEILDWLERHTLRAQFFPRSDQARVLLKDGTVVRIRAVQPYHAMAIYTVWRPSKADRVVERLEQLRVQFNARNRS